jgi:hypothetical protein
MIISWEKLCFGHLKFHISDLCVPACRAASPADFARCLRSYVAKVYQQEAHSAVEVF